jgi:hypothetical protein
MLNNSGNMAMIKGPNSCPYVTQSLWRRESKYTGLHRDINYGENLKSRGMKTIGIKEQRAAIFYKASCRLC